MVREGTYLSIIAAIYLGRERKKWGSFPNRQVKWEPEMACNVVRGAVGVEWEVQSEEVVCVSV